MVLYVGSLRYEPFYAYRRHFLKRGTSNELALQMLRWKQLDRNGNCNSGSSVRARQTCLYDTWLEERLLAPFNCTLFYLRRGVEGYHTCDPDLVLRNYRSIVNTYTADVKVP